MRTILQHPNKQLRVRSQPVPMGTDIRELVRELREVLVDKGGIGIAAPQIGEMQRIVIIRLNNTFRTLVNPSIAAVEEGEYVTWSEACLSVGHGTFTAPVRRFRMVKVNGFDEGWNDRSGWLSGMAAAVAQHELDHLDGVLFLDRAGVTLDRPTPPNAGRSEREFPGVAG